MCLLSWCGTFKETAWIIGDGGRLDGTGSENPGPPTCFDTAPDLYKTEFLSRCFTSTETIGLIRDGGNNGTGSESPDPPACFHTTPEL